MKKHTSTGKPQPSVPKYPTDLFKGTAEYYAEYRLPYPQEFIDDMLKRTSITGDGNLLDLACGTGEIALTIHKHFDKVWAIDQEPDMIRVGQQKAKQCGATNIQWVIGRAEDAIFENNFFELITIGSAFHRLDRQLIAERARQWLSNECYIAIVGNNATWNGKMEWQRIAAGVIKKWLGKPEYMQQPQILHEEFLANVGYEVVTYRFPMHHIWTIDSFIGYLYSTARASKRALGKKCDEFEADMRQTLLGYEPNGLYPEVADFYCVLAKCA